MTGYKSLFFILLFFIFLFAGLNFFQMRELEELEFKLTKYSEYSQGFNRLHSVFYEIRKNSLDQDKISDNDLFDGAIEGMVKSANDFNVYLKKSQEEKLLAAEKLISRVVFDQFKVGYIRIPSFYTGSSGDFEMAVKFLSDNKIGRLIIDLRNNLGGSFGEAVEMANVLLESGRVMSIEEDSNGKRNIYKATGVIDYKRPITILKPVFKNTKLKLILLVNQYTASASEVLSAALKYNSKAVIMGQNTYGKGLSGRIFSLPDGSYVLLITRRLFGPNGEVINGVGIKPDIYINPPKEKFIQGNLQRDEELFNAVNIFYSECSGRGKKLSCYDYFLNS